MVDADHFQWNAQFLRQLAAGRIEFLPDLLHAEIEQGLGIGAQIINDDAIAIGGMLRHWHYNSNTAQAGRVFCRHMHDGMLVSHAELLCKLMFVTIVEYIVEQAGLLFLYQLRQCNGGADIHQGIMRPSCSIPLAAVSSSSLKLVTPSSFTTGQLIPSAAGRA